MKICLLGATGRTGKHLLQQTIAAGHTVKALVRDPRKVTMLHPALQIIKGDPADNTALETAIRDCDVVISTLNISRTSDFPWAALRTPKHFLSSCMKVMIGLCEKHRIQRLIVTSAWGVADSRKEIPGWFGWLIDHSNIRVAYEDHALQESLLQHSSLHWTIVRPVVLTNSAKPKKVRISFRNIPRPKLFISRKNLAAFLIDIIEQDRCIRQMPVVYT